MDLKRKGALNHLCWLTRLEPFKSERERERGISEKAVSCSACGKEMGKSWGRGMDLGIPFVAQENVVEVVIDNEQLLG